MSGSYLGRQPILDRSHNLVAFELLFRQEEAEESARIVNDLSASANVIVNAYGKIGIHNVLGQLRGFINADPDLIMSDMISLMPSKHIVLEIKESVSITPEFLQHCKKLKQKGYQFALDNTVAYTSNVELLLPLVSIVKVDVLALSEAALTQLVARLNRWPVLLLALKVENQEQETYCRQLGFQMFQGYYFAKPEVLSVNRAEPSRQPLLRLLSLTKRNGTENNADKTAGKETQPLLLKPTADDFTNDHNLMEIEKEFKNQPGLSYNLLRMANSGAEGPPQKISSIRQALKLMGRMQLQKWLQLLLFTSKTTEDDLADTIIQNAITRGKMMEIIATLERPHDKNYHERAYLVGILSPLNRLLDIGMQQIVDKLGISDDMQQALLTRQGHLGRVLKLIEAKEQEASTPLQALLAELGFIDMEDLQDIEAEAMEWISEMAG